MADETIDLKTDGDLLEDDVVAVAEEEDAAPSDDEAGAEASEDSASEDETAGDDTVETEMVDNDVEASVEVDESAEDANSDSNDDEPAIAIDVSIDVDEVLETDDSDDSEEEEDEPSPPTSSSVELTEEELAALDAEIAAQLDAEAEQEGESDEWYFVHTYSGMENKVKKNLEHRTESMGMSDRILQVVVPTETEVEIRKGVRKEVEKRVFPGYILVNMVVDEDSWYVVRNTPGVTGFVGMGNKPTPLSPEEVERIMERLDADEPIVKVSFALGENVRILGGPFAEFNGIVEEIYADKGKAKVMVSFFNRETPVEVDFVQLEKEDM